MKHPKLIRAMISHEKGCPARVQHFIKVHNFARTIGILEQMDEDDRYILEAAAIVHDIGIRPSLEKYGDCTGPHQEAEGPPLARQLLESLGYTALQIERVCYLVAHHHTYTDIDGQDYQILIESDFLVNIHEGEMKPQAVQNVYERIFRTAAGKQFCREMFLADE